MTTAQTNSTNGGVTVYGYPLTLLIYDPQLPAPTAADPYAPQNTCADIAAMDVIVGGSGDTLQNRLTALDAQITASPTDITDDLATAIDSIDSSATVLSTAIDGILSQIN